MNAVCKTTGRFGLHYFADSLHYRERDLEVWLPQLQSLGVAWLTLWAPQERAVPEYFIQGLLQAGIHPILHMLMPIRTHTETASLRLLLHNYARWGVRFVAFFEKPNMRHMWHPADWAQANLVERFMDLFVPLAGMSYQEGITPVFPPMQPGGDYWDTVFIREAVRSLARRAPHLLEGHMAWGAYAWAGNVPLDWGAGGIERWGEPLPYARQSMVQDHRGFRIFDWYASIIKQEVGWELPIIVLRCASWPDLGLQCSQPPLEEIDHQERNLQMALQVIGAASQIEHASALPSSLVACNFWLLACDPTSPYATQVWFKNPTSPLGFVERLRGTITARNNSGESIGEAPAEDFLEASPLVIDSPMVPSDVTEAKGPQVIRKASSQTSVRDGSPLFSHYVLLPVYAWGEPHWNEKMLKPLFQNACPTIGTSLVEARLAERVTVVGGTHAISDQVVQMLKQNGCVVERLLEDGTLLAT